MEVWQSVLLAMTGNTLMLAVLGFLGKSFVNNLLTKDIKKFEIELKGKSDTAIARLKNELEMAKLEHQVIFSKLHEKRAEVIAEVYKRLAEAHGEVASFLAIFQWAGEPSHKEKYVTAYNRTVEFYRFFDQHRIYLPEELCKSLDSFTKALRSPTIKLGTYIKIEDPIPNTLEELHNAWVEGWKSMEEDIPRARQALEEEFRKILEGTVGNGK
jgi:hypothetical protein